MLISRKFIMPADPYTQLYVVSPPMSAAASAFITKILPNPSKWSSSPHINAVFLELATYLGYVHRI